MYNQVGVGSSLEVGRRKGYTSLPVVRLGVVVLGVIGACLVLSNHLVPGSNYVFEEDQLLATNTSTNGHEEGMIRKSELDIVLENASMEDKTVIITNLNDAWAEPNSIFDLFLESFRIGNKTQRLVKHLVVICFDEKAYNRCLDLHPHCYHLQIHGFNFTSEAFFMTPRYLEIVWRKIELLATVLDKGYNFVFSDTDIMWLRDPFPRFDPDADLQTSCDMIYRNSSFIDYLPNTGFNYVKSNNQTIQFYKVWYESRKLYPSLHDQDVFKKIINDSFITNIGLKLEFLDTSYFGGFCEPSKDLRLVCTMHANCCVGLQNKIHDLQILLEDWKKFMSLDPSKQPNASWSDPQHCRYIDTNISLFMFIQNWSY
ncbi:hypothetical protein FEM48_Zijuj05G0177600 [Ziziphus jujuba var. spinosa]|uniref:Nucleotide-diphospho-sugar transferase domain-containing protein n=1 Tax=Ziziphus jujuba var. spinosa TaxID=714518 RepID=A0A978VG86_ZIZJJ|nr:hypothetical protein FEM48_Zijuj05G0177600 [Ziziphus jujuba var. spinosa]